MSPAPSSGSSCRAPTLSPSPSGRCDLPLLQLWKQGLPKLRKPVSGRAGVPTQTAVCGTLGVELGCWWQEELGAAGEGGGQLGARWRWQRFILKMSMVSFVDLAPISFTAAFQME